MVRPYEAFFNGYRQVVTGTIDVFARPIQSKKYLRAFDAGCEAARADIDKREEYRRNEQMLKEELGELYPGSSVVAAG